MVESQSFVSSAHKSSNKTLWYVLAGVIGLAVVLGGAVWWYGNSLIGEPEPSTPPRQVVKSPTPTQVASPSAAVVPNINLVGESKSITFPKAGRVYLYYLFFNSGPGISPYVIDLVTSKANISIETPEGLPPTPDKMHVIDTELDVAAGEVVAIQPYDFGNFDAPSTGWIKPVNGTTCGSPTHLRPEPEIFAWMRADIAATGEPIVSEQCWTDMDNGSDVDYNDFLLVFTYGKPLTTAAATTSPSPSPSASAKASATVSPSPSPSASVKASVAASPSPSPSPSVKASTTTTTTTTSATPTATPRTATVDTSSGVPVTGVIEDTIKGVGVGIGLLVLGLLLL